jgi:hypothetical protein
MITYALFQLLFTIYNRGTKHISTWPSLQINFSVNVIAINKEKHMAETWSVVICNCKLIYSNCCDYPMEAITSCKWDCVY